MRSGSTWKRKLLAGIVVLLATWPIAHMIGVARYRIDAWEFLGWGMYSLPSPQVHVRIEQLVEGRPLLVRPSEATLAVLDDFSSRRTRFGSLAEVEPVARRVLALEPHMEGVELILRRWELDRETAHFDFTETRHRFER
jgi:hypothetical protein